MSSVAATQLPTDRNCQHPFAVGSSVAMATAAAYPVAQLLEDNDDDDRREWDNLASVSDDDEISWHTLRNRRRRRRVGSCLGPASETTAAMETATPTAVADTDAKGCTFGDLARHHDDDDDDDDDGEQEDANKMVGGDAGHLLDGRRLLPVARVFPISVQASPANGCPLSSGGAQRQDDLLLSFLSEHAGPTADTISTMASDAPLDALVEKYLTDEDRLNLCYYLNEYETNGCDLSELLANLIQNLLAKLPNSLIRYKLLSWIKKIYIEDSNAAAAAAASAAPSKCGDENPQLDLLLFDTMIHQYLMASNFKQQRQPQNDTTADYLAERKRKRRQRRAAQLAAARYHQGASGRRRETSPFHEIHGERELRNLGGCGGGQQQQQQQRQQQLLRPTNLPQRRYCYADGRQAADSDQEEDERSATYLISTSASSTPQAPRRSRRGSIEQDGQDEDEEEEAISNAAASGNLGQLLRPLVAGSPTCSSMDSSGCIEANANAADQTGNNFGHWHERNLLSSDSSSSLLLSQRQQHLTSRQPSNQNIYPPQAALFAKQRQHYHAPHQQQQQQLDHHYQNPSAVAAEPSGFYSPPSLIPADPGQQSWPADYAFELDSHGINSSRIAFGGGAGDIDGQPSSDWLPVPSCADLPSGSIRQQLRRRAHFGDPLLADDADDDDAYSSSFNYEPLLNNTPTPPSTQGNRSLAGYPRQHWRPQQQPASCESNTSSTSELLHLPPVVGGSSQAAAGRIVCQCDRCCRYEQQLSGAQQRAVQWSPYLGQAAQRPSSVQNHQLAPGINFCARPLEQQRCFSTISVHYGDQKMPPSGAVWQQRGFVGSPPADCCQQQPFVTTRPANHQQQQRLLRSQAPPHSSLPSSPRGHYLRQPPPSQPPTALTAHSQQQQQQATLAAAADCDGERWLGGRQDHRQSIQLKDWPYGNTQSGQQLSAAPAPALDSRRSQQNVAFAAPLPAGRHQSAARSATIDNSSSRYPRASNRQEDFEDDVELEDEDDYDDHDDEEEEEFSGDECALVPLQAKGKLPLSVAEQMERQASRFVHQYGSAAASSGRKSQSAANRIRSAQSSDSKKKPNLLVRRTLRVKIKKSKPILGIAIEGGFNVSGQLLPRVVCVHEDGAAYQCGKLRASDLILEVNGKSTVNMTHDQIARTIATAYYQDPRPYIEFLIGESMQAA